MANLQVVALISGGKDSLFSILHCVRNGHKVVALANLHPSSTAIEDEIEDLESYMYQTIGHAVIPLYEQALALPLYRQAITGSAVDTNISYGQVSGTSSDSIDETEDLLPLLLKVKAAHPEVNAVSTGAILSNYQRTRVESVAVRCGLTPLSYLWQWPTVTGSEVSLLASMAAVGQDSRIIKIASGGMDESFLWQNVAEPRTRNRLAKAARRFGTGNDGAVLGEGGEYETLAVSGPAPVWKGQIVVDDEDRTLVRGEAGSASVRLRIARVVLQDSESELSQQLAVPSMLGRDFQEILSTLKATTSESIHGTLLPEQVSNTMPTQEHDQANPPLLAVKRSLYPGLVAKGASAAEQMRSIMNYLSRELGAQFGRLDYTSIVLRKMEDFAAVNTIYGSYFDEPNPPARVTVACSSVIQEGCDVVFGCTVQQSGVTPDTDVSIGVRRGLHVQSRSYWAPANIGPYSQAIISPVGDGESDVVYVAGQIPLEPASMSVVGAQDEDGFALQAVLALQHLDRIGKAIRIRAWIAAIAFVALEAENDAHSCARKAQMAWESYHRQVSETAEEEDGSAEDFDVWSHARGAGHRPWVAAVLDDTGQMTRDIPPLWVIKVDELPRGAKIEWVAYGTTKQQVPEEIEHLTYLLNVFRGHVL